MTNKKLIVGLGNIGSEYDNTRHNIGFAILDKFKESCSKRNILLQDKLNKKLHSHLYTSQDFILLYPQTYMNNSGQAVRQVIDYYKINNLQENLLIIHDDVSLPLGRIRWQANSGAGGQHGVESIIQHLGNSKQFPRLKFGIGPDPGGDRRGNYVLGRFPQEQHELLNKTLDTTLKSLEDYIFKKKTLAKIMNEYNKKTLDSDDKIKNTKQKEELKNE